MLVGNSDTNASQVLVGVVLGLLTNVLDLYLTHNRFPGWDVSYWALLVLVFVVSTVFGAKLPLWLKGWATTEIFLWGALSVNYGRTFGVHLTFENLCSSAYMFLFLWPIFTIPLFRLWKGKLRFKLFLLAPLFSFTVGLGLASLEETLYVRFNSEGAGATARWFVNTSGMSYEPLVFGGQPVLRGWD